MAKEDWKTIKIPTLMITDIDKFVKTDLAKKNGITSRDAFATAVLRDWFSRFEKDYGLFSSRESAGGDYTMKPPEGEN